MKNLFIALFLFISVCSFAQPEMTLYVSASGNDANPGTMEQPLADIHTAWQKAKKYAGKRTIIICCRQGTYYLSAPIVITSGESGTKEHPVRFCSLPGERAVINTSKRLSGLNWTPYNKEGIMQATVTEDLPFDQLFVNGSKQPMARYPDQNKEIRIFNGYAGDAVSPERVARWSNPEGGYIHAMHKHEWGGYQYLIKGKDKTGQLELAGGFQNNRQMGMHDRYRMVENIFEELDAEGEWYFDRKSKVLYYYPPKGIDLQTAVIETPCLESIFVLNGREDAPVKYVEIDGLELTQTLRTFMKTEEPLLRSDWKIYRGGAIQVENAENCSVSGCYIHDIGGNAIFFSNYNRHHLVAKNHITQIGASAVCFVGSPKAVRSPLFEYAQSNTWETMDKQQGPIGKSFPSECRVDNNLIHLIGETEKQGAGIQISMSSRITVSHNSIYDLPRAGINISEGTWGGHVIEGNDVFDTVLETGDHGSFNSWGRDRFWLPDRGAMNRFVAEHPQTVFWDAMETTIIRNNRWRCDHGWDIDLDDGSSNYHIYNNLCLNGGLKLREGFARTVENNVIVNNSFHPHVWFKNSGDVFRHNIVTTGYRPIQVKEWGKLVDSNFFIDPVGLEAALKQHTDTNSQAGDPLFVNPSLGDYRLKDGSPALKAGFSNFDMDQFGVQEPELKALARTPVLPVLRLPEHAASETKTYSWKGLVVKPVSTEGERSATGLDKIRGMLVVDVKDTSIGIQPNDVILTVNGVPVNAFEDLQKVGARPLKVTIFRNQKEHDVRMGE